MNDRFGHNCVFGIFAAKHWHTCLLHSCGIDTQKKSSSFAGQRQHIFARPAVLDVVISGTGADSHDKDITYFFEGCECTSFLF